jgi:putative protease
MPKAKKPKAKAEPKAKAKKQPKPIGKITHFFPNISVAVVELNADLKEGEKIKIAGHGKEFEQKVASMQIEHEKVKTAKKGQSIGMKVDEAVKEGDLVYKA